MKLLPIARVIIDMMLSYEIADEETLELRASVRFSEWVATLMNGLSRTYLRELADATITIAPEYGEAEREVLDIVIEELEEASAADDATWLVHRATADRFSGRAHDPIDTAPDAGPGQMWPDDVTASAQYVATENLQRIADIFVNYAVFCCLSDPEQVDPDTGRAMLAAFEANVRKLDDDDRRVVVEAFAKNAEGTSTDEVSELLAGVATRIRVQPEIGPGDADQTGDAR